MARTPLIAGNWKMYKTAAEGRELARAIAAGTLGVTGVEILLCPPFTALAAVADELAGTNIKLGAQNCYYQKEGAFTGEVSAPMLAALGVEYVIIGHSERRQYFREDDRTVNLKVRAALAAGLKPIVCVGETLAEREAGEVWKDVVARQVTAAMADVDVNAARKIVIAYEPVWAIGTGKTATPAQAAEAHALVRARLAELYDAELAGMGRILYGGSVKPDNIAALMAEPEIDGALVGGASLSPETFLPLVRFGP